MSCNNGMSFSPSNFMIQTSYEDDHPHQSPSPAPLFPSCSPPQDLHGFASFLGKRSPIEGCCDLEPGNNMNGEEDYSDDGSQMGEKKRRLNMEPVKTLEKNFELGNKLEPERKMQLACALGLQQRQIAIWFQNRRARWKKKCILPPWMTKPSWNLGIASLDDFGNRATCPFLGHTKDG